ncbi:MAG: YqjD family protein [Spirochaetales bacterium]
MSDVRKSKDKVQEDLNQLVSDTKDLLSATAGVADKQAKAARARVEASLGEIQDRAADGVSYVRTKAGEQIETVDRRVRSNPYEAVGISFGVGLILGFLVSRN